MSDSSSAADLKQLASRAEAVRAYRAGDSRPVVVEFSGSPKAGKTTCIDIISHFFKRTGFKIWAPTEGASKRTPYHLRRDLVAFNCWSLNYAISELLVAYNNVDPLDLVILDRGPFDSIAWMKLLFQQGKLEEDELDIIYRFALHPRWADVISRLYLFTCDPKISLERENNSKLTERSGTAMNTRLLEDLLHQYEDLKQELAGRYPVHPVNTSENTTPRDTAQEIASDILTIFEGHSDNG